MPTCPAGHDSASSDFCDVCGMRIGGSADASAAAPETAGRRMPSAPSRPGESQLGPSQSAVPSAGGPPAACPRCGAASSGRFCESCGFDFDTGQAAESSPPAAVAAGDGALQPGTGPAAAGGSAPEPGSAPAPGGQAGWTAVMASDRAYYETVIAAGGPDAASIQFPAYCPERRFRLTGPQMRIGRHSSSRGQEPEIDLTGPPTDPGISRLHAVLIAQPDGSWAILDPGSENGTSVNGNELATGAPVALHDGDQIHIGAWTVITVHTG